MFSAFLDPQAYSHVAVDIPFLTLYFSLPNLFESQLSFEEKKENIDERSSSPSICNNHSSTFLWIHNILLTFKQFIKDVSFFNQRFMLNAKLTVPANYFQASCSSWSATPSTSSLNSSFIRMLSPMNAQIGVRVRVRVS